MGTNSSVTRVIRAEIIQLSKCWKQILSISSINNSFIPGDTSVSRARSLQQSTLDLPLGQVFQLPFLLTFPFIFLLICACLFFFFFLNLFIFFKSRYFYSLLQFFSFLSLSRYRPSSPSPCLSLRHVVINISSLIESLLRLAWVSPVMP